jgi:hypothetical protein
MAQVLNIIIYLPQTPNTRLTYGIAPFSDCATKRSNDMTQTIQERNAAYLQKARDIVADIFVQMENAKDKKPVQFETVAAWAQHIEDYAKFMRGGAYDDDLAVQAALIALGSQVSA